MKNRINKTKMNHNSPKEVIAIGDIHGDLPRLKAILSHAGLINEKDKWIGKDSMLIQLGDTIDRTPSEVPPFAAFRFLQNLQKQAAHCDNSKVIRLLGNHELMLLEGLYWFTLKDLGYKAKTKLVIDQLAEEISQEVLEGKITGAWSHNDILFLHGGLRTKVRNIILNFLHENNMALIGSDSMLATNLKIAINTLLKKALTNKDFSNSIFWVSKYRGGKNEVGGVFWCDFFELTSSLGSYKIRQVVGHTPTPIDNNCLIIRGQWRIVCMDSAISRGYGDKGFMSYLKINKDGAFIWYSNDGKKWQNIKLPEGRNKRSRLQKGE